MQKIRKFLMSLVIVLMLLLFARVTYHILSVTGKIDKGTKGNYIAIIDLDGAIMDVTYIVKALDKLEKDDNATAYLLRIDSPGGAVVPSQYLHDRLAKIEKPLYVAMGGAAASGGYMAAVPADKIYAMPSTITGSIGVIMQIPNYEGLMEKVGIDNIVIASGEYKDIGNFGRQMTAKEREILNELIMDMYDQFVEVVSVGRDIPYDEVLKLADGRIYTGRQAHTLGLVDELGSWEDALDALKVELGNADIKYRVIKLDTRTYLQKMLSRMDNIAAVIEKRQLSIMESGFYYMSEY